MRPDMIPGATFPDYELSGIHAGKHRKLSELQGQHPMVLVRSRGGFCSQGPPPRNEGLVQLHRELEVGYCRLVTISFDNITETNEHRSGAGAHWPFLSDPRRTVQKDLDIAEYTDLGHNPHDPLHDLSPNQALSSIRPTTATGSSAAPLWKNCARTWCVL